MKYILSAAAIFVITFMMGMANDSETKIIRNTETVSAVTDTLTISGLKEQIATVIPDSAAVPDSLMFKKFTDICKGMGYNMPVFIPDDELTSSMPQIKSENIDTGIFIPEFMECLNGLKERKKSN